MAAELTVAVCAILKDEADYIEEWLAFHILQGVSRVVLYDNNSSDDTCRRALAFAGHVALQILPWPGWPGNFDLTQRMAYSDGVRRLARVVDYVAFIDLDEFLFASDYRPLGEVLASFPADTAAIAVNQRAFGSVARQSSTGGLVTSRFVMAVGLDHPAGGWFKTIARPERIIKFDSAHSVVLVSGAYLLSDGQHLPPRPDHPGCSSIVAEGALRLHHYGLKSREEFERKKLRWAGQDLAPKYSDEYFEVNDRASNEVRDERLTRFAAPIEQLIDSVRADRR